MIGSIRNKWLRRAAIVATIPLHLLFACLVGILASCAAAVEMYQDARKVWIDQN